MGALKPPELAWGLEQATYYLWKNDFRPFDSEDNAVWAFKHYTTWAYNKMEWTLCYLGVKKTQPRV
jgi:hypothetical protein